LVQRERERERERRKPRGEEKRSQEWEGHGVSGGLASVSIYFLER
jgi:hypothetical protein